MSEIACSRQLTLRFSGLRHNEGQDHANENASGHILHCHLANRRKCPILYTERRLCPRLDDGSQSCRGRADFRVRERENRIGTTIQSHAREWCLDRRWHSALLGRQRRSDNVLRWRHCRGEAVEGRRSSTENDPLQVASHLARQLLQHRHYTRNRARSQLLLESSATRKLSSK